MAGRFLLAKAERYFYDADAIKEKGSPDTHRRYARGRSSTHKFANGGPGKQTIARTFDHMRRKAAAPGSGIKYNESFDRSVVEVVEFRNKRTVWRVPSHPFKGAHFATFPPALVEPCILAGSAQGDVVLDPFSGASTTGLVARQHNRAFIGLELNPEYCDMAARRLEGLKPLAKAAAA